jgi:uncharacterized protein
VNETPFFFDGNGYRLFGVVHDPEAKSNGRGFVFCHPFAEEKLWTHRVFVNFSRILAKNGYFVLRFDYMGNGDSEGEFSDASVKTNLADIQTAVKWLQRNRPVECGTGLLGLRFGATLACLAAEKLEKLSCLVMWEPIVNGAKYMKEMLRINMSTQSAVYREIRTKTDLLVEKMKSGETVNIDGYEMGWAMYDQASCINLIVSKKKFSGRTFVVEINRKITSEGLRLKQFVETFNAGQISEALEDPFWKEIRRYYGKAQNIYRVTIDWLEKE